VFPFYDKLKVVAGAPAAEGPKRPLVMFSHGRGSNALWYVWFAQYLAERGFVVAAINHYHANTYDTQLAYLANRIWQRPVDISLALSFLLGDAEWSKRIDADRIGVAGHSQGGFTALWLGGAEVNPDRFLAFQRGWRNNRLVPEHIRRELPLDAGPARNVRDTRIKAAVSMAPGIIQAFGMDEAGLRKMAIPAYITVGKNDTEAPPGPNASFAAAHIPRARLELLPGTHEIYTNECNREGREEFPSACIDAPGVDRAAIHKSVGETAVTFFREAFAAPARQPR
jgi:predicted dienelactone hydrolase